MDTTQKKNSRLDRPSSGTTASRETAGPRKPSLWPLIPVLAIVLLCLALALVGRGWTTVNFQLPSFAAGAASANAPAHDHGTVDDDHHDTDHDHAAHNHADDDHAGHDPAAEGAAHSHPADSHPGHSPETCLELNEQASKNVGLQLLTVEPRAFDRTISIPASVVPQPGRTEIDVSAPMTGIVTRIYVLRGEAVRPGQPLFDLRLTHEDLVETQSRFLQTAEQLDVIKKEVARLDKVTSSGAVAGKRLLERQYEQQKTEAALRAQRQALILHGLSPAQVDAILTKRQLVQQVTVVAPRNNEVADSNDATTRPKETASESPSMGVSHQSPSKDTTASPSACYLQVTRLDARQGQHVEAGARLAMLADYRQLYIEGKAFARDAEQLTTAANRDWPLGAVVENNGDKGHTLEGLKILYVENEVERDSRALRFYVPLPNEPVREEVAPDGRHFVGWRYRPGQRVELLVPIQRWSDRIVLPVDAVVKDGAEWFVFRRVAGHFQRCSVHVAYRDQHWVVLGSIDCVKPGDVVAAKGAYQLHLALKNKSGQGIDPHAGHNH